MKIDLFKGAKFGDKFETRNGTTALFIEQFQLTPLDGTPPYIRVNCEIQGDSRGFFFYSNGKVECINMVRPTTDVSDYDIVSKYESEMIDENIVENYAREYMKEDQPSPTDYCDVAYMDAVHYYKCGFRKAEQIYRNSNE